MVEFAIDFYKVDQDLLLDDELILETMIRALKNNGAHIISSSRYHCGHNSPPGVICMVTIDESFCYCHSYADRGEMAFNVFTCGGINTQGVVDEFILKLKLDTTYANINRIERFNKCFY